MSSSELSKRELEVLRLAAKGQTDQGIANLLGIGVATVGTYWIRIRNKMGTCNRTELVARYLRSEAHGVIAKLREENEHLHEAQAAFGLLTAMMETAPDAILVVDAEGFVKLANDRAAELFEYEKGELEGIHLRSLVPKRSHGKHNRLRKEYMAHPEKRAMGDHQATSAVRKSGEEFQIAATLSAFESESETFVTCLIRAL